MMKARVCQPCNNGDFECVSPLSNDGEGTSLSDDGDGRSSTTDNGERPSPSKEPCSSSSDDGVSPLPSENGDVTSNPLLNDEEDLSPMYIGDVGPSWRNDGDN